MDPHFFDDAQAFRAWLSSHAGTASELLVGFHKLGSGRPCMSWSESVDEALCFGWIDGVRRRIDDNSYSIRFTPRKRDSIWSNVNIAKMDRLRAQGRMRPAGEAAFAHRSASKSGIYSHERSDVPALSAAELERFQREPAAWDYFNTTPPGYRKTILHWITSAKKDDTRAARLDRLVRACADGTRLR
ncbi:YdeI/OmpD-associated family protein [Massilia sp. UBA6681]|jgi:uncharacterized protein YdeI (YjbR/CyaY-like superfamily)|uniref:YdeI/OmpD-associated family protein n=1 Tax=Massilia sp. UBA6681 TaxID=1946839 RepID=UPI0025BC6E9B|nr:YdeI/OmpD-associated family protein [Massilia sp. UBA6681]